MIYVKCVFKRSEVTIVTISFGYILYCVCFNLWCGFNLFCNVWVFW